MNEKISIIMGTYDCCETIEDAVNSIIKQTYTNWELIVCDDCSTDNTYSILEKYKEIYPDKIILLKNKKNSKLAYTLNKCLKHATGHFVARMDGDDISSIYRFEEQIAFLENNPSSNLVGTAMQRFDNNELADIIYPVEKPDKYTLKYGAPFNHATIMTYKFVYDDLRGYTVSKRTVRSQDYDLWFRFYKNGYNGSNIMEPLYYVRENTDAIKRRTFKVRLNAYKTTLIGFRLLNFPIKWYIRPTILLIVKGIVPLKLIVFYRKFQKINFYYREKYKR